MPKKKPTAPVTLHPAATGSAVAMAGFDAESFARRVFAPERARLAEAWAAVTEIDEPAEAWEALASRGLIPMEWVGDARRQVFGAAACAQCGARPGAMEHAAECTAAAVPTSVGAAVTLASDAEGVATVETLALEAYRRISSDDEPARVVWRVLPGPVPATLFQGRPGRVLRKKGGDEPERRLSAKLHFDVGNALAQRLGAAARSRPADGRYNFYYSARTPAEERAREIASDVYEDLRSAWSWDRAVREKRPNPFTPLAEIWHRGYKLETFSEEMVVLVALEAPTPK